MKVLISFATEPEARASLKLLSARKCGEYFEFSHGWICVGGVGVLATVHALAGKIAEVDEVWNLGVAGSLTSDLRLGDSIQISTVSRQDVGLEGFDHHASSFHSKVFPRLALPCVGKRLVSCDYPVHHTALRAKLSEQADLVDMEGYGVAYAASRWGKPCSMWKVVSDFASENGPLLIREQIDHASVAFASTLEIKLAL